MKYPIALIKIITHPERPHMVAVGRGYGQRLYHNTSNASFYRLARLATESSVQHLGELTEYVYRYKRKESDMKVAMGVTNA